MRFALGVPGGPIRVFLDTSREADVSVNLLGGEVAVETNLKASQGKDRISADGRSIEAYSSA